MAALTKLAILARVLAVLIDVASATCAGFSASYWWKASALDIPPPGTCFDGCGPNDPFVVAFQKSAALNVTAARFAAWAAALLAAGIAVRLLAGVLDRKRDASR